MEDKTVLKTQSYSGNITEWVEVDGKEWDKLSDSEREILINPIRLVKKLHLNN